MKVLVGTLFAGEGDFDRCCNSVRDQSVPCEQFVIKGLRETEAHKQLYATFKASDADFFLKLDADMVLKNKHAVETMVRECSHKTMCVTAMVDDYFAGEPIYGMHLYTPLMEWNFEQFGSDTSRPDQLDSLSKIPRADRIRQHLVSILDVPLALHCHYATDFQSFHYGYHRSFKNERHICDKVISRNKRNPRDSKLRLAAMGILAAKAQPLLAACSYGKELKKIFEHYKSLDKGGRFVHHG